MFQDSCDKNQQQLTFCEVAAHWQNRIAERFIGSIQNMANTILLHGMAYWPGTVTEGMWPFAVRHAVNFHNSSVWRNRQASPYKLFTGQDAPWKLNDFRTFGCPVFVLDKKLQDGDSVKKWRARGWKGIYVGQSMVHASNVPLVYNIATTHVTPQFHLVFDEGFTTVTGQPIQDKDKFYEDLYNNRRILDGSSPDGT